MTEQRHVFITPGISREAFVDTGVRLTNADPNLDYYVHQHRHDPYENLPCNNGCTVIHMGEQKGVTQSDDANQGARA